MDLEVGGVYNVRIGKSETRKGVYLGNISKIRGRIFVNPCSSDRKTLPRAYNFDLIGNISFENGTLHITSVGKPEFEGSMKRVSLMAIHYLRQFKSLDGKLET